MSVQCLACARGSTYKPAIPRAGPGRSHSRAAALPVFADFGRSLPR